MLTVAIDVWVVDHVFISRSGAMTRRQFGQAVGSALRGRMTVAVSPGETYAWRTPRLLSYHETTAQLPSWSFQVAGRR